ncbi:2-phosphosulfolactate phosphatase [Streptosporangium lutulentum]
MDTRFLGIAELVEAPSVAVVVDVMRAFTVAAWAFAQGAEKIVLAESLDEALALKARHPNWVALKDGPPAPGFDTVNSPGLLRSMDLGGRTVVQKTTAGTVGALAVKEAPLVLCAASWWRRQRLGSCGRARVTVSRSWSPAKMARPMKIWRVLSTSPGGLPRPGRTLLSSSAAPASRAPPPNWRRGASRSPSR